MARRRLYVFAAIIILGVLVGIFCLPNGGEQQRDPEEARDGTTALEKESEIGRLPQANMNKEPAERAKGLVEKAARESAPNERLKLLKAAHDADPSGRWGGEAALRIGDILARHQNTEQARRWYGLAIKASLPPAMAQNAKDRLAAIARQRQQPVTRVKMLTYRVQPGDSLWKIARRHATTVGAIKKANRLTRDMIRVDARLKVPKGPFDVRVTKSAHTLVLLQDGKPVKVYAVGLGRDDATPAGSFVVTSKLEKPVWYSEEFGRVPNDDKRNVLGSRWIGFNGRIGIHGTRKEHEDTIGKNMSDGCVRMRDADVKEVYNFLVEHKSKVTVVE